MQFEPDAISEVFSALTLPGGRRVAVGNLVKSKATAPNSRDPLLYDQRLLMSLSYLSYEANRVFAQGCICSFNATNFRGKVRANG